VWQSNVPHTFLAMEKSDQHWMVINGEKVNFPGGGTHFHDGAEKYIASLAKVCIESGLINSKSRLKLWRESFLCLFHIILKMGLFAIMCRC
jgi:hypothetical protein